MSIDEGDFFKFARGINLKDAHSYKEYDELENVANGQSSHENIWSSLKSTHRYINEELFRKISRNLETYNNISDSENRKERCKHYKYWAYGKMMEIFQNSTNSNISDVINEFLNVHKRIIDGPSKISGCEIHFILRTMDQLEYLLEQKHLDNYFRNFENIKNSIKCDKSTVDIYIKYLNRIIYLYNRHKDEEECCDEWGINLCNEYFSCLSEFKPTELKSKLECGTLHSTQGSKEVVKSYVNENPLNSISSEGGNNMPKGEDEISPFVSVNGDILPQEVADSSTNLEDQYNIMSSNFRDGLFGASIIGTIFFFIYYFRFRNCGPKLHKKSRKKKIYEDYVHEENEQELSMDDFEPVYIYTQSNRLYMAYHPARNSDTITRTVHYD
ncbi:PIR Superfamily Protein [Plasmodium ovale wallikeri]|uniref:PIR Superfamily Protein n=2 Tax=Plasmodium ovale TaxID=36330 RepID=A0A1A9A5Q7_PLAOA|nr:PIR Superfamily Protein [Plasmodium ovale wallikeri]SBT54064.1 PIR Superfamily Protein [Plasmodium ovale wallikeri]SBT76561.1 PIR protein [Plasmodium ovale]